MGCRTGECRRRRESHRRSGGGGRKKRRGRVGLHCRGKKNKRKGFTRRVCFLLRFPTSVILFDPAALLGLLGSYFQSFWVASSSHGLQFRAAKCVTGVRWAFLLPGVAWAGFVGPSSFLHVYQAARAIAAMCGQPSVCCRSFQPR